MALARALVCKPALLVADEPTSMLDAPVRAAVVRLMLELRERLGTGYLYVTHDLALAGRVCDRIAVMYRGKIVEQAPAGELLHHPMHPYTRALLSAIPDPWAEPPGGGAGVPEAAGPPVDPPPRCRFLERCPVATRVCREADHPSLEEKAPAHRVACYVA